MSGYILASNQRLGARMAVEHVFPHIRVVIFALKKSAHAFGQCDRALIAGHNIAGQSGKAEIFISPEAGPAGRFISDTTSLKAVKNHPAKFWLGPGFGVPDAADTGNLAGFSWL